MWLMPGGREDGGETQAGFLEEEVPSDLAWLVERAGCQGRENYWSSVA